MVKNYLLKGVGGFVGTILTGFFATSWVTAFDGTSTLGGVVDGQGLQLGYQLVTVTVIPIYTLVVTYLILHVIENVMNIPLRPSEDDELDGVDICDMGEIAYDLIPQEDKPKDPALALIPDLERNLDAEKSFREVSR
jgi:Amt family ammonium transporter